MESMLETCSMEYFSCLIFIFRVKFIRWNDSLRKSYRHSFFVGQVGQKGEGSAINAYVASLFDQTLSWKDVQWLNSITKLPILLKGKKTTRVKMGFALQFSWSILPLNLKATWLQTQTYERNWTERKEKWHERLVLKINLFQKTFSAKKVCPIGQELQLLLF